MNGVSGYLDQSLGDVGIAGIVNGLIVGDGVAVNGGSIGCTGVGVVVSVASDVNVIIGVSVTSISALANVGVVVTNATSTIGDSGLQPIVRQNGSTNNPLII